MDKELHDLVSKLSDELRETNNQSLITKLTLLEQRLQRVEKVINAGEAVIGVALMGAILKLILL